MDIAALVVGSVKSVPSAVSASKSDCLYMMFNLQNYLYIYCTKGDDIEENGDIEEDRTRKKKKTRSVQMSDVAYDFR